MNHEPYCMIKKTLITLTVLSFLLTACKHSIDADKLYGSWRYIKVEKPRSDDAADTTSTSALDENKPYINFSTKNELTIYWGGKILSHGTFKITDNNINYTEQLGGGQTRTFPFYVSELSDKQLIFETLDKDGSRVTAIKK